MSFRFPGTAAVLILAGGVWLTAQSKPASVREGVYTSAQASSGAALYKKNCESCHGATLEGRGQIPPLAGADFLMQWSGQTLGDLFEKQQTSMPADRPGQLSGAENAEIVAYLLQYNQYPAGAVELAASAEALRGIKIEAPEKK